MSGDRVFYLFFSVIVITALFLLVVVPFVEQFTDLASYIRIDIKSDDRLDNFTLVFPV